MKISIVLAGTTSSADTRARIARVQRMLDDCDHEFVVVAARSDSLNSARLPQNVSIVRASCGLSTARQLGLGFSAAEGDVVVWCPSTIEPSQDFVEEVQSVFSNARKGPVIIVQSQTGEMQKRFTTQCFAVHRSGVSRLTFMIQHITDREWVLRSILRTWCWSTILAGIQKLPTSNASTNSEPTSHGNRLRSRNPLSEQHGPTSSCTSSRPDVSVIITAHNEGAELRRTLRSIRFSTRLNLEILIVDDGSTDGSCDVIQDEVVSVIRHEHRVGVAASRHEAALRASGDVLCFLDGHQRLSDRCLDACAEVCRDRRAIVSPDIRGFRRLRPTMHGARFRLCPENGYFSGTWVLRRPSAPITRSTTLRAPGYMMSRTTYDEVAWCPAARGWGASEAMVSLKAFFSDIDILQVHGPVAYHLFRRKLPYATTWNGVWLNHAIAARVCFNEATWKDFWLPHLFAQHLDDQALAIADSETVLADHRRFQAIKRRKDADFWKELLGLPPPPKVGVESPNGVPVPVGHRRMDSYDDGLSRKRDLAPTGVPRRTGGPSSALRRCRNQPTHNQGEIS